MRFRLCLFSEQRLYQLIRQPKPIADRLFEIEFLAAGVEAFVFTSLLIHSRGSSPDHRTLAVDWIHLPGKGE